MFCRPGYNMVLLAHTNVGRAVWVWFRPKWESGIVGTERKDKLRAIECTLFRNESGILSSVLVTQAAAALLTWDHARDVEWEDGMITGINSNKTSRRRSKHELPGRCYRAAGWVTFQHRASDKADVWLTLPRSSYPDPQLPNPQFLSFVKLREKKKS